MILFGQMRTYKKKLMDKQRNREASYYHLENASRISIDIVNLLKSKLQSLQENLRTHDH